MENDEATHLLVPAEPEKKIAKTTQGNRCCLISSNKMMLIKNNSSVTN